MDKYEYNLKLDQLKSLSAEGKYTEAAEIADSINWNKIRNVNALVKAGEIYENVGRYEDSRDILLNAYDNSPIGRTIIYRLAEVAIKMKDFEGAKEYYNEFIEIAPHDNQRYVLKYDILKATGAAITELIPLLEDFKEQEYTEEWAYELAYLYHKAGYVEKCIEACDELILWFGDGPYVERALELKMLYQPLSKSQEDKYRKFRHEKEGKTLIEREEMIRAGEYAHDPVVIPQVTLNQSKFNTVNLQEEIAKGMQQIMEATEKETVVGTMDSIKKIVEEIPYLQIPRHEENIRNQQFSHIETDEEIDGSLKINFQELLGEESDGQMSLATEEKVALEKQITGQMTIAEVLEEWEKTKRAAETALFEAEQRKLESAKARALQEAEDIMERLNDVLPKIEAGVSPKELLEEEYLQNKALEDDILRRIALTQEIKIPEETLSEVAKEIATATENYEDIESEEEIFEEEIEESEEEMLEEVEESEEEILEEEVGEELSEETLDKSVLEAELQEPVLTKEILNARTMKMPEITMPEDLDVVEKQPVLKPIKKLTDEQKTIFSYFVPVKGLEPQLCEALTGIITHLKKDQTAAVGNLIIQGTPGSGKTMLSTSIVKVLQIECGKPNGRVGKIDADALNKKDLQQLLRKVAGGCLIIERAGELNRSTAVALSLLLEQDNSGIFVIMEDTAGGIKKALSLDDAFAKKFTESVTLPIFSNDELVTFAKSYANELGYEIDEMAVLALYNRISNIQKLDQATRLEEIKDIVDEAIGREARSGLRKFFGILTANRYTDDEQIVLTEKDFV